MDAADYRRSRGADKIHPEPDAGLPKQFMCSDIARLRSGSVLRRAPNLLNVRIVQLRLIELAGPKPKVSIQNVLLGHNARCMERCVP